MPTPLEVNIRKQYAIIINKIQKLIPKARLNDLDEFFFRNNPEMGKEVTKLLLELNSKIYGVTVNSIQTEWDEAVEQNNEIAKAVFGKNLDKLPKQYLNKILSTNAGARKAFIDRKIKGLGLSDRIWKNTRQYRQELELAIELGIGEGKSAANIAKDLKKYLIEPNRLYRRILDKETGVLRLSKAALAYNPGRGIYRSSYKNALRLARNETNFAYEESNKQKREQQDFVVGIEIKVSPSHQASDDKGGISCLSLQGKYKKDFDFTNKWHVNCKCVSYSILKSKSELDKDLDLILEGKEPTTPSKNQVNGLSKNFTKYVKDNEDLWKNWKNKPRFLVNL